MGKETTKRSVADRFWGRMAMTTLPSRIVALVFVAVSIASMAFCQLGFWPAGEIDGSPVYLILLVGPVVMGAFMFGPLTGALLGVLGGLVAFVHAAILPVDYYEIDLFGNILVVVAAFTLVGFAAGVIFDLLLKRDPQGSARVALIVVGSAFSSALASILFYLAALWSLDFIEYPDAAMDALGISFASVGIQALVGAAAISVLCLCVDHAMRKVKNRGDDRMINAVFRNWLILVSAIIFMAAGALLFTNATLQARDTAAESMERQIKLIQDQLNRQPNANVELLVNDYSKEADGVVAITNERGVILASNDGEQFKQGTSLFVGIGMSDVLGNEGTAEYMMEMFAEDSAPFEVRDTKEKLGTAADLCLMSVAPSKDGYIVLHRSAPLIYASRFNTMFASTSLAILLIAAVVVLATILLRNVVVRHIDSTNESLAKITAGDLRERVAKRDTREFTSLANGINSTVDALGSMIDEVAKRNEQDLKTAKTIQESSLPTEFPAFPDIDRFDIYANMKTAKEVGGDFYDFFQIEDTSKIGFVMADVSGKGIPAALFMMSARGQLRNYLEAGMPVNEAVYAANHQLCTGNDAGMFVTCWVAELDYATGELSYVNAGHNPPVLLHDGAWSLVTEISGMPLGLFDGIPYDPYSLTLEPDDMIYAYTDGVTEAMSASDELFGEERLMVVLKRNAAMNPRSICVAVRRELTDFTHDAEQSDDITMLALKYGVPPETEAVMVLPAEDPQLVHVCNFIHGELDRRKAPKHVYNEIDIAAEELFVNVCHYAYPDAEPGKPGEVRIGFDYNPAPPTLKVTISDDGIPYDPTAKPDAVTPDDIADVPIGGLGILMVKRNVDELTYERVGESNVVSFTKSW